MVLSIDTLTTLKGAFSKWLGEVEFLLSVFKGRKARHAEDGLRIILTKWLQAVCWGPTLIGLCVGEPPLASENH